MKRTVLYIILFGLAWSLTACGVSESEYESVVQEKEALKSQLEEMQDENRILNEAILEIYKEREGLQQRVAECQEKLEDRGGPDEPENANTTQAEEFYTVKPGDTLGLIANETGVSVDVLQKLNVDTLGPWLMPGQKIRIK